MNYPSSLDVVSMKYSPSHMAHDLTGKGFLLEEINLPGSTFAFIVSNLVPGIPSNKGFKHGALLEFYSAAAGGRVGFGSCDVSGGKCSFRLWAGDASGIPRLGEQCRRPSGRPDGWSIGSAECADAVLLPKGDTWCVVPFVQTREGHMVKAESIQEYT